MLRENIYDIILHVRCQKQNTYKLYSVLTVLILTSDPVVNQRSGFFCVTYYYFYFDVKVLYEFGRDAVTSKQKQDASS